jgi:hypothetical protein
MPLAGKTSIAIMGANDCVAVCPSGYGYDFTLALGARINASTAGSRILAIDELYTSPLGKTLRNDRSNLSNYSRLS